MYLTSERENESGPSFFRRMINNGDYAGAAELYLNRGFDIQICEQFGLLESQIPDGLKRRLRVRFRDICLDSRGQLELNLQPAA